MTKLSDAIDKQYDKLIGDQLKLAGLALFVRLRQAPPIGTPLDTRWHAASWRFTVDKIDDRPAPRNVRDRKKPLSVPLLLPQDMGVKAGMDSTVYVTNHSDVIEALNAGLSQQTRANFVKRAQQAVAKATRTHARAMGGGVLPSTTVTL